ncbi:MAG: hypothetical protein WBX02_04975 [Terriglobales bacterium]
MPTKDEHVKKAEGNETFAAGIPSATQTEIDWTLVVLFYAAVHYVEAYLYKQWGAHVRSHTTRDKYFAKEAVLKKVFSQYSHLKYYGYNARYEVSGFTKSDTLSATKYLDEIKKQIIPVL